MSPTFHGRDLFAPVAALIAAGRSLAGAGAPIDTPHLREELTPVADGDRLRSLVVSVDHFGNCITGVRLSDVGERRIASLSWPGGESDRVVTTYAEIDGTVAALWNSSGHLELAAREASAAERARIRAGMPITVALR